MRTLALLVLVACGGPTVAPPEKKQAPELHPPGAADCSDAPVVAFDQLASASGRIALDGVPFVGVSCTEMECTDGRACCNRCDGEYGLREGGQVRLAGLPGCSGMDCNTVCEPFGRKPTTRYRFVGTYDPAQRLLAVEKFCVAN